MFTKDEALNYHESGRRGKIEVTATKPCRTQKDLSLAYTPGVAEPCREIQKNPKLANRYTARQNLVAVITNGTAVLGLGDIGALAGKPVMEGKAVLFKRFADIDVFDLELNTRDKDKFIEAVMLMEPTFGGINLEDICAPDCFYIERELKKRMSIPVFHDDQHGTAIISGAALLNAVELQGKDISKIKVVFSGTGAAGTSCAKHYIALGVKKENLIMCDRKGVIYKGRTDIAGTPKEEFAVETSARTLEDAMENADCFAGLSAGGLVSKEMIKSMDKKPIIFAMANPDPEISYDDAKDANPDCIMATGRSDYPNQVNNVLGFPFIFRGALDVCACDINEKMKLAATFALANLAKKGDVPYSVLQAYNASKMEYGKDYIIPKPLDPRVLVDVSLAVAKAAVESGVAKEPKNDWSKYEKELEELAERIKG
ncbi:MAG: NAD-dependent malic enzyme [Chitinispirillales bacterium]|jgi:malate dehydrogenase (oxaloacetate-decarboxylating)(NADP+)|nr:NAD-dependent malic enzyme [Chitinispirillales bacterium]